jgi:retinoblastoma-associated protein
MSALPQQTPITLMMEVSRWITELQSSVVLEANTNFIKFDIPV